MERKQRLFLVACCRRAWKHIGDKRSQGAVEVAEQFADQLCDLPSLEAAHRSAQAAAKQVGPRSVNYAGACAAAETSGTDFEQGFDRCIYGADVASLAPAAGIVHHDRSTIRYDQTIRSEEKEYQSSILRCLFGNPFRTVNFEPSLRTEAVVAFARGMYESRDFAPMPVLADALEDAGCADADILAHCRGDGPHVRGCWVVDLVLGKS